MLIEFTKNGRRKNVNAKAAKLLIQRGLAREVVETAAETPVIAPVASPASPPYETRALQATDNPAPYGFKADGTPRKRPGRAPAARSTEEE